MFTRSFTTPDQNATPYRGRRPPKYQRAVILFASVNVIPTQTSNDKVDLPVHPAILKNRRPSRRSGVTSRNVSAMCMSMIHRFTDFSRTVSIVGTSKRARSGGVRRMTRKLPLQLCRVTWGWRCMFGIQPHMTRALTCKQHAQSTYIKLRSTRRQNMIGTRG